MCRDGRKRQAGEREEYTSCIGGDVLPFEPAVQSTVLAGCGREPCDGCPRNTPWNDGGGSFGIRRLRPIRLESCVGGAGG